MASTTDLLRQVIKSANRYDVARTICHFLLDNWEDVEINKANKIGFWWFQGGRPTDVIYVHPSCNPIGVPSGPWQLELPIIPQYISIDYLERLFTSNGFHLIEKANNQGGNFALGFTSPNLVAHL